MRTVREMRTSVLKAAVLPAKKKLSLLLLGTSNTLATSKTLVS